MRYVAVGFIPLFAAIVLFLFLMPLAVDLTVDWTLKWLFVGVYVAAFVVPVLVWDYFRNKPHPKLASTNVGLDEEKLKKYAEEMKAKRQQQQRLA